MKKDIIIKIVFGLLLVFCIYLIVSGLLTKDESAPVENTDTNIYETDLILSENNISLYVGETHQVTATVVPSNATFKSLTWTSIGPNIATVDNGLITGISEGNTMIRVTTEKKNITKVIQVQVNKKVIDITDIIVKDQKIELYIGDSYHLEYEIVPSDATNKNVSISSSNKNVIAFNQNKDAVAVGAGDATITISSNNISKQITVHVKKKIDYTFTCSGVIDSNGTNVKVTGNGIKDVKKFTWILNGKSVNGNANYINKTDGYASISVKLKFSDGTTKESKCSVKDNLPYHFKNEANRPMYSCGKISDAENDKLNSKLNSIINNVGKGTRAGVVEAGRFLMGYIQYTIPYQGRGHNDIFTAGLHFGNQSNSWGCRYEGYINGMDCSGFMNWPYYTNGIKRTYTNSPTPLRGNVDKVRVGDVLVTYDVSQKPVTGIPFGHDEVIIGIDDDYIYTLSNGLTITSKKNPPSPDTACRNGDCFDNDHHNAYYRNVSYPNGDGKVTNMWIKWHEK